MERDFAVRFTDDNYSSKEEVKKALAISSIDAIWSKILNYRSYFRKSLDLKTIENKIFNICLTSTIQQKMIFIEKKISKNLVYISRLDGENEKKFIVKAILQLARSYAKENSLTINDDILLDLINNEQQEVPQAFLSLKNYIDIIKFYLNRSSSRYDLNILTSFYGRILKKEINSLDYESYIRIIDHNNPSDHVIFGRHYNAAPIDKIVPLLEDIMSFNKGSAYTLIQAIVTYFYLIYIKPFDYFNEECAVLSLKYIIANSDLDVIPFLLNFERFLLNSHQEDFNNKFIVSELSLDLTYFVDYVLDEIKNSLNEFDDLIADNDITLIKSEFSQNDEVIVKEDKPQVKQNSVVEEHLPLAVNFEQKVSMPTLPVGLDQKDIDLIAENLLELYPSLKKMQAKFYAGHCTIGKYYSIAQYKKETGVAYETARTSMDNLATLGFYKKEQIKNKFVYTPVVR